MRKAVICFVTLILLFFGISSDSMAGLDWGVKAGLSAANLIGEDNAISDITPGNRLGLSAGGYFIWKTPWHVNFLSSRVAFQAEFLYSMKGAKYTTDLQDYTFQYDYLEFPFLMKLTSTKDKPVHASLYAGITAGVKVGSELSATSTNLNLATSATDSTLISSVGEVSGVNDYDAGIVMGVDFDLVDEMLLFDVRYYMGMMKVPEGSNPPDVRNSNLMILLGFKF